MKIHYAFGILTRYEDDRGKMLNSGGQDKIAALLYLVLFITNLFNNR